MDGLWWTYIPTKLKISSVAEAESGALFVNAKEGTVSGTTLAEMGHNQDATELKTDNTTADGIINNTVQQKRSKAMDMRLYWIKDRVEQDQFNVGWAPGDTSVGDYFTKHHSSAHHKCMIPYYLDNKKSPMIRHDTRLEILQGCVDISPRSQSDWALSALNYGLTPNCNLSQSRHGHTPISCTHTTRNSNTNLSQVSYRNCLDLSTNKDVTNLNIRTHKCTSILMLTKCILMHPTSILVRLSRPCL
jgi:hypothetical protein